MRRYSPPYRSPPRRGYGGRGRSPPPRRGYGGGGGGGYGGRKEQGSGSLLVRNIPLSCRAEDLRSPFERYGPVRDVYLPKDYYSGEPRGFAFVEFVDPYDASEAQYCLNRSMFMGREITVVLAAESRKRPEDMRSRARVSRGYSGDRDRRSSYHGRSRSRSVSRSRSPRHRGGRPRSRSHSPAPRRRDDYSASPPPRRGSRHAKSPPRPPKERDDDDKKRRSYSPDGRDDRREPERRESRHAKSSPRPPKERDDDDKKRRSYSPDGRDDRREPERRGGDRSPRNGFNEARSPPADAEGSRSRFRSPRQSPSASPPGSRSRSANESPARSD